MFYWFLKLKMENVTHFHKVSWELLVIKVGLLSQLILMIEYFYLQIAILKVDRMQNLKGKLNSLNLKTILKMKFSLTIKMYHMII